MCLCGVRCRMVCVGARYLPPTDREVRGPRGDRHRVLCSVFPPPPVVTDWRVCTSTSYVSASLGLKSAKDLCFGRREGFLARYERANALPPRPRVRRARVCPFFPVPPALAAVAPLKGRQLGAKCRHEGRRCVSTPSFSRTRPPKGDLCGTWSVHA